MIIGTANISLHLILSFFLLPFRDRYVSAHEVRFLKWAFFGVWFSWKYRLGCIFWSGCLGITQIYSEYSFPVKQLKELDLSQLVSSSCPPPRVAGPFMESKPEWVRWVDLGWLPEPHSAALLFFLFNKTGGEKTKNSQFKIKTGDHLPFFPIFHGQKTPRGEK